MGKSLTVEEEPGIDHDRHAICVKKDFDIVGHLPRELPTIVSRFLVHNGEATCEIIGRRKFGFGLEAPCVYKFTGSEKLVERLKSKVTLMSILIFI